MLSFIDTHTHIFLEEFDTDRNETIERAIHAGVGKMILPNVDSQTITPMLETCKLSPGNCFSAIGLHPCSVKENYIQELQCIENALNSNKFIAIGEIGIDLYWDKTHINEQKIALYKQIEWALHYNLPVILHCRESIDIVLEIVSNYKKLRGVFHAFSGSVEQAKKAIDLGFYLGIGGVVTYKNSGLVNVLSHFSPQNIVLETDSPYLTPVPHRGKRNESAYIIHIAEKLAEIFNTEINDVASITTRNAEELFHF
jgi:TatD DNase family protein